MAVPIQFGGSGQVDVGEPVALFAARVGGAVAQGVARPQYDVSPDGQRS
jgi:hypothetical protein